MSVLGAGSVCEQLPQLVQRFVPELYRQGRGES